MPFKVDEILFSLEITDNRDQTVLKLNDNVVAEFDCKRTNAQPVLLEVCPLEELKEALRKKLDELEETHE